MSSVLFQNSTSTKKPAVWSMVDVDRRPDCSFFGRLQPALFITPFFRQICFSLSCKCSFKFYSFLTKHIRRDPPSFIFIVFFFSIVIKLKRAYQQIGLQRCLHGESQLWIIVLKQIFTRHSIARNAKEPNVKTLLIGHLGC